MLIWNRRDEERAELFDRLSEQNQPAPEPEPEPVPEIEPEGEGEGDVSPVPDPAAPGGGDEVWVAPAPEPGDGPEPEGDPPAGAAPPPEPELAPEGPAEAEPEGEGEGEAPPPTTVFDDTAPQTADGQPDRQHSGPVDLNDLGGLVRLWDLGDIACPAGRLDPADCQEWLSPSFPGCFWRPVRLGVGDVVELSYRHLASRASITWTITAFLAPDFRPPGVAEMLPTVRAKRGVVTVIQPTGDNADPAEIVHVDDPFTAPNSWVLLAGDRTARGAGEDAAPSLRLAADGTLAWGLMAIPAPAGSEC